MRLILKKNPGSNTLQNSNCAATDLQSGKASTKGRQNMLSTAGEANDVFSMDSHLWTHQQKFAT